MNTQKIFLFIAIFLTIFILWDKWELTQSTDEYGNTITQTAIVGVDSEDAAIDVPAASDVPNVASTFTEDTTPTIDNSFTQGAFTTVVTDLLTVEISHKGGTIIPLIGFSMLKAD